MARPAVQSRAATTTREVAATDPGDVVVISADGKGVVMRPDGLRDQPAQAAASAKLTTRLSKGEKRNRKRMATVGAVHDATPAPRTRRGIMACGYATADPAAPPPPTLQRPTTSG